MATKSNAGADGGGGGGGGLTGSGRAARQDDGSAAGDEWDEPSLQTAAASLSLTSEAGLVDAALSLADWSAELLDPAACALLASAMLASAMRLDGAFTDGATSAPLPHAMAASAPTATTGEVGKTGKSAPSPPSSVAPSSAFALRCDLPCGVRLRLAALPDSGHIVTLQIDGACVTALRDRAGGQRMDLRLEGLAAASAIRSADGLHSDICSLLQQLSSARRRCSRPM